MRSGFPDETKHEYLTGNRLKKITLRFQSVSAKSTREVFYQDTSDTHAYVAGKNSHLRKTLDKKQAGTVISSFEYELDAAGNRLGVTDASGKYTQFGIDPKRQLVSETKWSAKTPGTKEWQYLFQYDPNQNRIFLHKDGVVTPYTYGDNNEMLTAGSETWTWDHFGNAKTKVVSGNTTTFGWSFESELISVDYPGTSADDSHEYDGNHLRMRSKLNGATNWTNFIHDELTGELLAEYTLIAGTYTIKALNTYGLGLISSNREGTKRYFHFDALGSTAALADENEVVKDNYTYEAFGVVQSSTSTNGPSTNPFRFVGQWGYYDDGAMGGAAGVIVTQTGVYAPAYGRMVSDARWSFTSIELMQGPKPTLYCLKYCQGECDRMGGLIYECYDICASLCLTLRRQGCDGLFKLCSTGGKLWKEVCLQIYLGLCFGADAAEETILEA